tara:strand:+ start:4812 stop:5213 length:402 start_codon:yes stop_codon:yes gene_type:complete
MDLSSVSDAPDFSKCVDGKVLEAKVISVYDGDSIKVIFPLNGVLYRWSCRLNGVDTPEIRTRNLKEKEMGYKVRDLLRDKILNKVVTLNCGELDKYGRLLVDINYESENINNWLITNGYAYEYNGGRKKNWDL